MSPAAPLRSTSQPQLPASSLFAHLLCNSEDPKGSSPRLRSLVEGQCVAQLRSPAVRFDYAICNDGLVQAFTIVHVLPQSEYFSLCEMTREGARGTWEVSARAAIRLRSQAQIIPQENGAVLRTALRRGHELGL